jgi:hypothetical protein
LILNKAYYLPIKVSLIKKCPPFFLPLLLPVNYIHFFFLCFSILHHAVKKLKFGNARQSIGISALYDASRQIPSYLKMTAVRAIFKMVCFFLDFFINLVRVRVRVAVRG